MVKKMISKLIIGLYILLNCIAVFVFKDVPLLIICLSVICILLAVVCNHWRDNSLKCIMVTVSSALICMLLITLAISYKSSLISEGKIKNIVGMSVDVIDDYLIGINVDFNKIEVYGDNLEVGLVIGTSYIPGVEVSEVMTPVTVYISSGLNPDGVIDVEDLIGINVEDLVKEVEELKLTNVKYLFADDDINNIVLKQSIVGEMKRSDEIVFTISRGDKSNLFELKMPDLMGLDREGAEELMNNSGLLFEIVTEPSKTVAKDLVISQSVKANEVVNPNTDGIEIVVSLGDEIRTIAFTGKELSVIEDWSKENGLKLEITEKFDEKIPSGFILGSNKKVGTLMKENGVIKLTVSKGPLEFKAVGTLSALRDWGSKYDITINEVTEFSDTVAKGGIIKFSHKDGQIVKNDDYITVYISQGKELKIPNFVGMSKSEAVKACENLRCEFIYSANNDATKDTVLLQSKNANTSVVANTSITITLSPGPAESVDLVIQESWLVIGNADNSIKSLTEKLKANYPSTTFIFAKRAHNTLSSGMIHPDSDVTTGTKIKTGETYTIIIIE